MRFIKFCIVMSACLSAAAMANDATIILPANESGLDLRQSQTISEDAPFSDVIVDHGAAWVAGKLSIWRWAMEQHSLVKIPLLNANSQDRIQKITATPSGLIVASNASLFQISFSPKKVVRSEHPHAKNGKTIALQKKDDKLWWIHEDGVMQIQKGDEKAPTLLTSKDISGSSDAWFDAANQTLWATQKGRLVAIDFRHNPAKTSIVHQAKDAFIGLESDGSDVYASTNFTVLRFNATERNLVQIIPVEARKKLLAMEIEQGLHTYLFNDTLLELFDLTTKQKFQTKLSLPQKARIEMIKHDGDYTVVLLDDKVTSYLHQNRNPRISSQALTPKKG